ncbi:MAG: tetratricopeptide repeat protein [Chloroflexi bacterium]|nr:tetratricopeptide repeat protein [Chloroflexota bacterium]
MRKIVIFIFLAAFVLCSCGKNQANKDLYSSMHTFGGTAFEKIWLWDASAKQYNEAIKLNPKNASAHRGMASVYFETQKYDDAIRHTKRAIQLDPSWVKGYMFLAKVYEKDKQNSLAAEAYQIYLDKSPGMNEAARMLIEDKIRRLSLQ